MKQKTRYEKPTLVDMNVETARGTSCSGYGINASYCDTGSSEFTGCADGSCVNVSKCTYGTQTTTCITGTNANCNGICACCGTGSGATLSKCLCSTGNTAGQQCQGGGYAYGNACSAGTNKKMQCL